MTLVSQMQMKLAAEKQCQERSEREGVPCYVFVNRETATWYVVSDAEPKPEGTELVWAWPLMKVTR